MIVAQGAIGFVQYFTDLPIVLVGFHMLGAALVSAAVTWVLLTVREPLGGQTTAGRTPGPLPRPRMTRSSRFVARSDDDSTPRRRQRVSSGSSATATKSSER